MTAQPEQPISDEPLSENPLMPIALTHSSWANEQHGVHNERLEFLGDAVLQLAITELLYRRYPQADEGDLSRIRQQLVNTERLAELAREDGLGDQVRLGKGEEASGGRLRPKLLAGLYEAVLGAHYLHDGWEDARELVAADFSELIESFRDARNPKQRLQEWCQARTQRHPVYRDVGEEGPEHRPIWRVAVEVEGEVVATGEGATKKLASANAAAAAVEALGIA